MKAAISFLAAIGIVHLLSIFAYPWPGGAFLQFIEFLAISGFVFGAAFLLSKVILKDSSRLGSVGPTHSTLPRSATVTAILVVVQLVFVFLIAPRLTSFLMVEAFYYVFLVGAGISLALWAHSKAYAGAVAATVAILVVSSVSLLRFFGDPSVDFQYGPEKWIFGLQRHLGRMNMWPLDAAVTASACLLAGSLAQRSKVIDY